MKSALPVMHVVPNVQMMQYQKEIPFISLIRTYARSALVFMTVHNVLRYVPPMPAFQTPVTRKPASNCLKKRKRYMGHEILKKALQGAFFYVSIEK
jgi:hypothetical protein